MGRGANEFGNDDLLLLKKGAPDLLLPNCSSVLTPSGEVVSLDNENRARIVQLQESWASRGQRVLLLARKVIKAGGNDIPTGMGFDHTHFGDTIMEVAKSGLIVIGMVGIVVYSYQELYLKYRILREKISPMLFASAGELEYVSLWSLGLLSSSFC